MKKDVSTLSTRLTNHGGLKHTKVQNKTICQYENPNDADHCVVNLFVKCFDFIPNSDGRFYFQPLPNKESLDLESKQLEEIH